MSSPQFDDQRFGSGGKEQFRDLGLKLLSTAGRGVEQDGDQGVFV
jgi:hypothetical protein